MMIGLKTLMSLGSIGNDPLQLKPSYMKKIALIICVDYINFGDMAEDLIDILDAKTIRVTFIKLMLSVLVKESLTLSSYVNYLAGNQTK